MSSGFRAVALSAVGMSLLACVSVRVGAAESGVSGTVIVTPALPGPQRAEEPSGKPLPGAKVELRGAGGTIVARANADANGVFRILAPGGQYELRINTPRTSSRCQSQSVQVVDGQIAHLDIACDSGMR
jgi:hypothetical protein